MMVRQRSGGCGAIILLCCLSFAWAVPYEPYYRYNFTRSRYSRRRWSTTTEPVELLNETTKADGIIESATGSEFSAPLKTTNDSENEISVQIEAVTLGAVITTTDGVTVTSTAAPIPTTTRQQPLSFETTSTTTERVAVEEPVFARCGQRSNEDFPWIAVLEHTDPYEADKRKTLSKGVLITPQHVLTTVSSLYNSHPFWTVSKVRFGDVPTWGDIFVHHDKANVVTVDVEHIFQHEKKDIAIVKLAEPVNISEVIAPVCLPDHDNYNFRELQLHVCHRQTSRSEARVGSVPATPLLPQDCSIMFERKHAHYTLDEFCAWDEPGDTCTGDLGGPLTAETNQRTAVIGLNSYIHSKEEFDAVDYPGIYTRVGAHLKWIRAVLKM